MRLLLPLSLVVLAVYLLAIPFNFWTPFQNRDVLIIYNAMLFAVMALLVGATPVRQEDAPARFGAALGAGIVALAILALLVSLYAVSATAYRTLQGWLTPNRLTVIGWNVINIGILGIFLYRVVRSGREKWVAAMHRAIGVGAMAYVGWTVFLLLALPLLVP